MTNFLEKMQDFFFMDFFTTTNNSLQHQAAWGQHSYARSSSNLIYLKPPSLQDILNLVV